jgi:hypothetical protein
VEAGLTTLDTTTVEVDCLRKLLVDLPIDEKPLPTILITVTIKW